MKITKKLMTCLLLPLVFSTAPAEEDNRDCNFFARNMQSIIDTWNKVYRKDSVMICAVDSQFLDIYEQFYRKSLREYVDEYHSDSADYYIQELEPGIDVVFLHLHAYYAWLVQYGQVCYGVSPETPLENAPDEYRTYIETIQNECRYLAMLILRHCQWGGGDNLLIGNEEHYDGIEAWSKKNLAPIPHLPGPPTDPTIVRIGSKLSENAMTQFAINFSMYEPEKLVVTQAFAYTNLLANMHLYGDICPLREMVEDTPDSDGSKMDYSLAGSLIIRQQDEWSRLMHYCFSEFFMPDCFGSYGTGSGVLTEGLMQRQLALLNYLSGNLLYPMEEQIETADKAAEPQEVSEADEPECDETEEEPEQAALNPLPQSQKSAAVKPGHLLPPFFLLFIGVLCYMLNRSAKKD